MTIAPIPARNPKPYQVGVRLSEKMMTELQAIQKEYDVECASLIRYLIDIGIDWLKEQNELKPV